MLGRPVVLIKGVGLHYSRFQATLDGAAKTYV
jgi:hypothetical protein